MTTTIQCIQTPAQLFADVTSVGRVDYGLWYVLNKMAQVLDTMPDVRSNYGEHGINSYQYTRWIGNKDADFILSRINFWDNVKGITVHSKWFYNRVQSKYELHHIMPDGTSLYVAIHRSGRNRNRMILVQKFDTELPNCVFNQ